MPSHPLRCSDIRTHNLEISLWIQLAHRNRHCLASDLSLSLVFPTAVLLQWDLPLILNHHGTELVCSGPCCSPESPPLSPPALLLFCASSLRNYLPPRTWGPKGNIEDTAFSQGEVKEVIFTLFTWEDLFYTHTQPRWFKCPMTDSDSTLAVLVS